MASTAAVFFDVDFTLIHPGPRFQGVGYEANCARHGVAVDPSRFDAAVAGAASALDPEAVDHIYDAQLFLNYTRRIIELMGGSGPGVDHVSREMYDDWAEHHHFSLYDDVAETFRTLRARGLRLGLISNTHRCLASFQSHFELGDLVSVAVSSSDHGFMKPHPSIFRAALELMGVAPAEAVMVGDSLPHDVRGARQAGMHGILIARGDRRVDAGAGVPVIRTLSELPAIVTREWADAAAAGPR
ncbi:MAG TPA: HAD family hydrolase [Vicinamibacterales bacterium]|nr:HAD family hydrolase [Vicinamibacterales bacterium]